MGSGKKTTKGMDNLATISTEVERKDDDLLGTDVEQKGKNQLKWRRD